VEVVINNHGGETLYVDSDDPVTYYRFEAGAWQNVRTKHGCVPVCNECVDYQCSACPAAPQQVAAGATSSHAFSGLIYGQAGFSKCTGDDGEINCFEQACAAPGLYKVQVCFALEAGEVSNDSMECEEMSPLVGPVCKEVEFDFPDVATVQIDVP